MSDPTCSQPKSQGQNARPRKPIVDHYVVNGSNVSYCGLTRLPGSTPLPPQVVGSPERELCDTCKFVADLEDELDAIYFGREANQ